MPIGVYLSDGKLSGDIPIAARSNATASLSFGFMYAGTFLALGFSQEQRSGHPTVPMSLLATRRLQFAHTSIEKSELGE